jgi:hypothetical protein
MKRYFKLEYESPLGPGIVYHEFDGEMPTRQVERYGQRWFSSRDEHHDGLGPGLVDQPLSALDLGPAEEVSVTEFEDAWRQAAALTG